MKHTTKLLVVAAAVFGAIGIAGAGWAYWTASGTGSAVATIGAPAGVTVQAVASGAPSTSLIPGGTADLLVQLNNPNSYPVTIVGVQQNGSVTPVNASGPGTSCSSSNTGVSVASQTTGLNVAVVAGVSVVHIPNGASMSTSSASGCQGASFQIPVTVTVQR